MFRKRGHEVWKTAVILGLVIWLAVAEWGDAGTAMRVNYCVLAFWCAALLAVECAVAWWVEPRERRGDSVGDD